MNILIHNNLVNRCGLVKNKHKKSIAFSSVVLEKRHQSPKHKNITISGNTIIDIKNLCFSLMDIENATIINNIVKNKELSQFTGPTPGFFEFKNMLCCFK